MRALRRGAVAGLLLIGVSARAGSDWKPEVTGCGGDPGLNAALELELGAPAPDGRFTVRVDWPCDQSANVVVGVEAGAAHLRTVIDLAKSPRPVWDRMLALVARQLLRDAREVTRTTEAVSADAGPNPPHTVPVFDPERPPLIAERLAPAPLDQQTPATDAWVLRAAIAGRVYASQPTGLGGGAIEGGWRWVRVGAFAEWTRVDTEVAQVKSFVVAAQVGAMPFRWQQDGWQVGVGAFVEGGVAASSASPKMKGYPGTRDSAPLGGVSLRTEVGFAVTQHFKLTLMLDAGYDVGLDVNLLEKPTVSLSGIYLDARLGIGF